MKTQKMDRTQAFPESQDSEQLKLEKKNTEEDYSPRIL